MRKQAVIFLAWGEKYIKEVKFCIEQSKAIRDFECILITDTETDLQNLPSGFTEVIRAPFESEGLIRKAELIKFLPDNYDIFLFLDSDTVVIEDISLGFEKAEKFSIAVSPAPHYSLDYFFGFDQVMAAENVPCKGQLQYNTGIIFFKNTSVTRAVFECWMNLALKHQKICNNDQPFFSLAMEKLDFNPYTLSISYNYRGFGDAISGIVRIWHSHGDLPENINEFTIAWPPRRAEPAKVIFPSENENLPFNQTGLLGITSSATIIQFLAKVLKQMKSLINPST